MKNVLIIGGNGYIGTSLQDLNYNIHTCDLNLYNINCKPTYFMDYSMLSKEIIQQYDVIILLAGNSSVKTCEGVPVSVIKNNVFNFINLVKKIGKHQKFIYASSSSIYGGCSKTSEQVEETHREYIPLNYYDLSKYEIDAYIQVFAQNNPIEYYGLRFGTVNGWSSHLRNDIMLNSMTLSYLNKKEVNISNKHIHRPILAVSDLGRAVKAIIESDENKRGIYNLASFNTTVEKCAQFFNCKIIEHPDKQGVYDFSISSNKFCDAFNFKFISDISLIIDSICNGITHEQKKYYITNRNAPLELYIN